jgi:site-specific DNA-methyltransferase (adenine-specific)
MLCDPPYHLDSITKRFGGANSKPSRDGDVYARSSAGFMGKKWDGGDIAFRPETWAGLAQHLHPGAFIMAFASTRGWHRQAVAMEDAGLIMHPSIAWIQSQGFPKATRIKDNGENVEGWQTHRYGRQAMSPSFEPILVFQKPYSQRPVDDIVQTGAGALNINGGRVGSEPRPHRDATAQITLSMFGSIGGSKAIGNTTLGRWPSNVILQHSPECTADSCAEGCACEVLGRQSAGTRAEKAGSGGGAGGKINGMFCNGQTRHLHEPFTDDGTAARFYQQSHWANEVAEQIAGSDGFCYQAKASRSERDAGLSDFSRIPNDFQRDTSGLNQDRPNRENRKPAMPPRNHHPTVKPLSLTAYLAKLLLPPDDYAPRRILIPFAGSGSEMIGAWQAGFEDVVGIEMMSEYRQLALARIKHWQRQGVQMELF